MAAITYLGEAGLKALIAKCKALAWEIEVVSSLPSTGEERILYLLKDSSASGSNVFDEYIWVDGAWEMLGTATLDIDLSNYATKTDLDTLGTELEKTISENVSALEEEIEDIKVNYVTDVRASASGDLTLTASKSDATVTITGSVDLSDYQKSADLTEITASDVETIWDEA